jgi:hypothetical protein
MRCALRSRWQQIFIHSLSAVRSIAPAMNGPWPFGACSGASVVPAIGFIEIALDIVCLGAPAEDD